MGSPGTLRKRGEEGGVVYFLPVEEAIDRCY